MMTENSIIVNFDDCKYAMERTHHVYEIIADCVVSYQKKYKKRPVTYYIKAGIEVYAYIVAHPTYATAIQDTISVFDINIPVTIDWSVDTYAINVNIK